MSAELRCYRCGASLASLTPPISRHDECPACTVYLHVCRMCSFFDPNVPKQCREDDAEEVSDKEKLNFCEWFKPSATAFDEEAKPDDDALTRSAEDLFK